MKISAIGYYNIINTQKTAISKTNSLPVKNTTNTQIKNFYNYPVNFGWCEKHNVRSKEVSIIFLNQLKMQRENEADKQYEKTRLEYLDIASNSNKESVNFLMQFANRQKNEAEFIPLWSLMNNEELRNEMQNSKTFSDPIGALISLNNMQNVKVKNNAITEQQLKKAQGSLQLHTAVILINQIEENLNNPSSLAYQNKSEIEELVSLVKDKLDSIYGKGIYEKVLELSKIGSQPDFASKKESLEILTKIDNDAKPLTLGTEYSEKLENLVSKQKQFEYEKLEIEQLYGHKVYIGEELSDAKKSKLNKIISSSSKIKERKAAEFMLKINREIRFDNSEMSHEDIHHREHLLGVCDHSHKSDIKDIELEDLNVSYHEHTHNGHTHTH